MPNERHRADVLTKLRKASRRRTLELDAASFVQVLKGESDRGAIILGATMVDDRLAYELEKWAATSDRQTGDFR